MHHIEFLLWVASGSALGVIVLGFADNYARTYYNHRVQLYRCCGVLVWSFAISFCMSVWTVIIILLLSYSGHCHHA